MRERLKRPEITADQLLLKMEAEGMQEAIDLLNLTSNRFKETYAARRNLGHDSYQ